MAVPFRVERIRKRTQEGRKKGVTQEALLGSESHYGIFDISQGSPVGGVPQIEESAWRLIAGYSDDLGLLLSQEKGRPLFSEEGGFDTGETERTVRESKAQKNEL
jgi:hypothetical protein